MDKQVYLTRLPSLYREPNGLTDDDPSLQPLFEEHGHSLYRTTTILPLRNDIRLFQPGDEKFLDANFKYFGPPECRDAFRDKLIEFWDCLDPEGLAKPIRGFQFVVDTGNTGKVVCCRPPRYGER